jgi:alkanesulfonate monooxygenase SsuD/methylene tetrahydromethanopterin reductase-like flavin-dependent oxidoreductase (luciferase family)
MKTSTPTPRGLGITAGLEAGLARDLAARCEQLGYHSLWSNDEPAASGLETLARLAAAAPRLELGVGVLPLDRHQPARIATEIDRLGIDPAKLWIGIGSGQLRRQIEVLERAVAELRELLPAETRIVIAAMRPRLCRLGGAVADGVLLNWMLPDHVPRARRSVQQGADEAGRAAPIVASYVRVAVGSGSLHRLREEERHYRTINEGHRKHFAAMDVSLGSVGVAASTPPEVHERLAPYQSALDLPIVRVLANADATSLTAVADAAAPMNGLACASPTCPTSRPRAWSGSCTWRPGACRAPTVPSSGSRVVTRVGVVHRDGLRRIGSVALTCAEDQPAQPDPDGEQRHAHRHARGAERDDGARQVQRQLDCEPE